MRKDKGVLVSGPDSGEDSDEKHQPPFPAVRFSSRNASSKYDFVKVKVWLGDNADHYYVLSRFLLSRMLTVTKIPNHVAVKIALELKKVLIDNSLLDVYATSLLLPFPFLFLHINSGRFRTLDVQLMERRGYGEEYINRYKMMTRLGDTFYSTNNDPSFHFAAITCHPDFTTKESHCAPLASTPVWSRDFSSSEELITEFCRECRVVRKGLAGDLKKAMKDGKPIIIEGIHLDPSIYLVDDEHKLPSNVPVETKEEINPVSVAPEDNATAQLKNHDDGICSCDDENNEHLRSLSSKEEISTDQVDALTSSLKTTDLAENISGDKGGSHKELETDRSIVNKEKSGPKPIIVPIVLKMAEFDHKVLSLCLMLLWK
ncbi:2-phosphoglycerate kinase isoform B [Senna tora]|uniref:2-phosphoglycerate kinase isoform B n=1 Tax=Senna tora TaxID=362788 RepID=A0A834TNU6_9FABA|nr:2-phosphoglycerate kinase isoform B [Senna tora]